MLIEVFALKLDDMPGQQFSVRIGHSNEATMEAIHVERVGDGIDTQYLKVRLKERLAGEKQGAGENGVYLQDLAQRNSDPAGADIDGPLDECSLRCLVLRLKTDGERHRDAIVFTTIGRRGLRSWGSRWHVGEKYNKKEREQPNRLRYQARLEGASIAWALMMYVPEHYVPMVVDSSYST